jgi:hypothetical protein
LSQSLEKVMKKILLVIAVISAGMIAIPDFVATSQARVNVDISINAGGRGRISCAQGRRIVERRGFRNVRTRSCSGNTFRYSGRRGRDEFRIDVRRRDGRIVGIQRR